MKPLSGHSCRNMEDNDMKWTVWTLARLHPDQRFTVERDGFYGSYFEPEENLFPGKSMIVCTGADGNFSVAQGLAAFFSDAGMPAMAVGYFNVPGTPKDDLLSPVEYIEKAAGWLKSEKNVHVGMWGISLGGEYALLCGSLLPEIECVVAVSPVHIVTECGSFLGGYHFTGGSPFSWRGKPVPYLPHGAKAKDYVKRVRQDFLKRHEFYMRYVYEESLMRPHDPDADIQVENIHGPVLLLSGGADSCVPASWVCQQVMTRLRQHHFAYPAVHHNYKYLSHYVTPVRLFSAGLFQVERKYPRECEENRKKSWKDTLDFLADAWKV